MTKGEAYRAYYVANRERILETNKTRAREKRQEATEEQQRETREKDRTAYHERKAKQIKEAFLTRAKEVGSEWKVVYEKLSTLQNLATISKKQFDFLLTLRAVEWLRKIHYHNRMPEPIVKVDKDPVKDSENPNPLGVEKKKTPGRKKKVVEPMKITLLTTPLILSFE